MSTDGTRDKLKEISKLENVRVIEQEENLGKGAALRAGFAVVQGEIVIIQDADLEYDPADYTKLMNRLILTPLGF